MFCALAVDSPCCARECHVRKYAQWTERGRADGQTSVCFDGVVWCRVCVVRGLARGLVGGLARGWARGLAHCLFLSFKRPADSRLCSALCVGVCWGGWSVVWCLVSVCPRLVRRLFVLRASSVVLRAFVRHSSLVTRHSSLVRSSLAIRHPSSVTRHSFVIVGCCGACWLLLDPPPTLLEHLLTRLLTCLLSWCSWPLRPLFVSVRSSFFVVLAVFVFACSFVCGLSSAL